MDYMCRSARLRMAATVWPVRNGRPSHPGRYQDQAAHPTNRTRQAQNRQRHELPGLTAVMVPISLNDRARFGDNEISRHALASGFWRNRGLAPKATYFAIKTAAFCSGAAQAARCFAGLTCCGTGRLAPFRYKVSGIGLAPFGLLVLGQSLIVMPP